MNFFHSIISILLALLIANPLCCCSASLFSSSENGQPHQSSCCACSQPLAEQNPRNDSEDSPSPDQPSHHCACSKNPADLFEASSLLNTTAQQPLSIVNPPLPGFTSRPYTSLARNKAAHSPPPFSPPLYQAYQVYRL